MSQEIRVLILEDDAGDAELIEGALARAKVDYASHRVATRRAFLDALDAFAPDVILSEYAVGGLSGLEALQLVRELQSDTPFIFITRAVHEDEVAELTRQGISDYVLKDNLRRVPAAVLSAIEKREAERARRQAFEALRESQHFVQRIADAAPHILFIYDLSRRRVVYCNRQLRTILGYSMSELEKVGSLFELKLVHPDDYARVRQRNRRFAEATDGEVIENEFRIRHANGEWRWLNSRETIFTRAPDHSPQQILGTAQDITERKLAEERINHLSYHDPLTSLPNRILFSDRLALALTLAPAARNQITALMLLDLDRFKTINDTLGQAVGDRLLKELASRLLGCVREGDTVARFGSDEFALLLTQINRAEDVVKLAQTVHDALQAVFVLKEHELFTTASIGISLSPFDGT
ncbi:MAG TPA: diguanylate cyclase, partial [Pyrinomonadaceae bacterium]|nr:diguanylate cyclase [Pyrinomonadaceae bacterium]